MHAQPGPIRVLYDHQAFTIQDFGGISRYHTDLFRALERAPEFKPEIAIRFSDNVNLRELDALSGSYRSRSAYWRPFPAGLVKSLRRKFNAGTANRRHALEALSRGMYDIFHPTYYDSYFLGASRTAPILLTVHDMIHELYPDYFPLWETTAFEKEKCITGSDHIIAVSQTTKRDIMRLYSIPSSSISVVYHGSDLGLGQTSGAALSLPESYFLHVGHRGGYKNGHFLWRALRKLLLNTAGLRLICAGGGPFTANERGFLEALGLSNRVLHLPVTPAGLVTLYRHAVAFIFPSLYEGFGIPILEAFNCQCPVLASRSDALVEVADTAARYFDPKNPDSVEEAARHILVDSTFRKTLRADGIRRGRDFSVEKCAKETAAIYRDLFQVPPSRR